MSAGDGRAATTVAAALEAGRRTGLDRLDAQLLLAHVLRRPRTWLFAHDDATLAPEAADIAIHLYERRAAGEPLAYLVGEKEFHGLALHVGPAVLVPRPDTEVLVDWAIELLADRREPRVVDLGTGSGAIALAVKRSRAQASMLATDISPPALAIARRNAERHGLAVDFREGSWWEAAGPGPFDLALSNPPYIAAGDPHLPALEHEPSLALTPGDDGLEALRLIAGEAFARLTAGGWLLLEHGHEQAPAVRALLSGIGLEAVQTRRDLGGRPRCTGGRRPAGPSAGP